MNRFGSSDRLAGLAGVAPVPRDSGNVNGNLHRPRRYHRGLQRVFYTSALISIRCCEESRRFYERKRAEGKRHTQAVLAPPDDASTSCGSSFVTDGGASKVNYLPQSLLDNSIRRWVGRSGFDGCRCRRGTPPVPGPVR